MAGNYSCMKAQGSCVKTLVAVSFSVKTTMYCSLNEFPENKIRTAQFKWLHHNHLTSKDKTIKILILI